MLVQKIKSAFLAPFFVALSEWVKIAQHETVWRIFKFAYIPIQLHQIPGFQIPS